MQRKLTLDPDTLRVASFEAGTSLVDARGTVEGREGKIPCPWSYITSCQGTFHTCASFDRSCRAEDVAA